MGNAILLILVAKLYKHPPSLENSGGMIVDQSGNANGKAAGTAQQCGPCCFFAISEKTDAA